MSIVEQLLKRRRLILTVAVILSLTGVLSWMTMVRQEDPRLPEFWGQVVVSFPGAGAEQVERLVLEPIEDHLAEVAEINWVESTAFAETAVVFMELRQDIKDTTKAWDEVREALHEARREFPEGVSEPTLNDEAAGQQESVVLALTGSPDPLVLLDAARRLRRELLAVSQVSLVNIAANPGEQVVIELDGAAARRLGVNPPELTAQLRARSRILPGGSLRLGEKTIRLRPLSEFESVEEIENTPVVLPSGVTVPLKEVARVRRGPAEPTASLMRFNSEMAVGLGVVAKKGTNLVSYGSAVRDRIDAVRPLLAPIEVHEVAFQPERVSKRIDELSRSLLLGIIIVAAVVILAMGLRLGLLVASVVPLVAMASLAIYAFGGGVLHQISIAALVLALGMLVDNAIVVAENVQWRLDRGASHHEAAVGAVRELAVPLGAATATTLAAFVPMLLAEGSTGAFTRAIPVLIMLTLSVSYFFAIFVTPVLSEMVLLPRKAGGPTLTENTGRRLAGLSIRWPVIVLVAALLLVGASLGGGRWVQMQFFPSADRNQLVVDIKLPEGTHLETTDLTARRLERALLARPDVEKVTSLMGRSAPKFYYNLARVPWSPHFAQLVVQTRTVEDISPVVDAVRAFAHDQLPGVEVVPRRLEQGPPVGAPVEIRLFGSDLDQLNTAAAAVAGELRLVQGTMDVRHDLSPGAPTLRFRVDDAAAARFGLSRADVAGSLYGHTRGLKVGELHVGEDPVPIVIRSSAGETTAAEDLQGLDVARATGGAVPLAQVASIEAEWRPAAIKHRNRQRVVTVSSQLADGFTFSDVLTTFGPRLEALELPEGVTVGLGGDAEGSGEANAAMVRTMPIGVLILLGVLLAEFNSFRRVMIILVTVPLAAAGVIPGLLISGQPFGFMSMLGVIALVGIVVNNAIVLLEVVDSRRREGATVDEALSDAVVLRIRPILLTTATTVAGLLPLALSSSTLWPPLAWAMISGLLASTLLTLVVVPALYRLLFSDKGSATAVRLTPQAAAVGLLFLIGASPLIASDRVVTLEESMRLAGRRPAAEAARLNAEAAAQGAHAERRLSYLPMVGASASASDRNRDLALTTPLGQFELGASRANSAGIELVQPLFDPARHLYANPASRAEADAAGLVADRTLQELAAVGGLAHLRVLDLEARLDSTVAFVKSLEATLLDTEARVDAGRALEADVLKIRLALERAQLESEALEQALRVASADLGRVIGIEGPASAVGVVSWVDRLVLHLEDLVAGALETRADIGAISRSAEALDLRRSAVKAEALPSLNARVGWSWTDGSPYSVDSWAEGAVSLNWKVFAAGTRAPRARALQAEREATGHRLLEARRAAEVEIRSALAALTTARSAVDVSERGVEQATENLRVERERHAAGRITTNDLLIAEAELREQRTLYQVAQVEIVRSWINLWLATGERDIGVLFG
ncbi:MAG: hypothetical protein DRJ65_08135 [Acidobacteria bacterium]|nr:MAG: hypothetical protein DRJ65_08135 [Acidobacteriota bacterium]